MGINCVHQFYLEEILTILLLSLQIVCRPIKLSAQTRKWVCRSLQIWTLPTGKISVKYKWVPKMYTWRRTEILYGDGSACEHCNNFWWQHWKTRNVLIITELQNIATILLSDNTDAVMVGPATLHMSFRVRAAVISLKVYTLRTLQHPPKCIQILIRPFCGHFSKCFTAFTSWGLFAFPNNTTILGWHTTFF